MHNSSDMSFVHIGIVAVLVLAVVVMVVVKKAQGHRRGRSRTPDAHETTERDHA
jgi:hypothetical protein